MKIRARSIIPVFSTLLLLLALSSSGITDSVNWKPGWRTGDTHFVWLDQDIAWCYELEYQLYLLDLDSDEPEQVIDRTFDLQYTYTPNKEGNFLVGVQAIKVFDGYDIIAGDVCWSNNFDCVKDGNTFYLKVQVLERGKNEDITRWKIVW